MWIATLSPKELKLFLENYYWIKVFCGLADEIVIDRVGENWTL